MWFLGEGIKPQLVAKICFGTLWKILLIERVWFERGLNEARGFILWSNLWFVFRLIGSGGLDLSQSGLKTLSTESSECVALNCPHPLQSNQSSKLSHYWVANFDWKLLFDYHLLFKSQGQLDFRCSSCCKGVKGAFGSAIRWKMTQLKIKS